MDQQIYLCQDESELQPAINYVISNLKARNLLLLQGNLGAGKTTFTKYLLKQFGIDKNTIKSPTYSLVNQYQTPQYSINHLDLYRLNQMDGLLLEEIHQLVSEKSSLTIVEWAERLPLQSLEQSHLNILKISFILLENNFRQINIQFLP